MKLLFLVLNKIECLEGILTKLASEGLTGATILDSQGLAQNLYNSKGLSFMASLRMFMGPDNNENKTVFMVLEDEKVAAVSKIVNEVTGGLDGHNTGILFTVDVDYIEGFKKHE